MNDAGQGGTLPANAGLGAWSALRGIMGTLGSTSLRLWGNNMTKRDLIEEVNKRFPHLSRLDAEVIINSIFDSLIDALQREERIEIRGFGSFVVKHRRARDGRNPKTGEVVPVSSKRVPFFKVGKELRMRVNNEFDSMDDPS